MARAERYAASSATGICSESRPGSAKAGGASAVAALEPNNPTLQGDKRHAMGCALDLRRGGAGALAELSTPGSTKSPPPSPPVRHAPAALLP